jgi:RND family efflux transporter MFP subunit
MAILMAACSPERTPDQVTLEINKTRNQIAKLNQQLTALETELATLDASDGIRRIKVVAEPVTTGPFTDHIELSGMVEAVNTAAITPEISGRITAIHVREGQAVRRGQKLISLDASVMKNSLSELEKGYELARTLYEKQKELWDQGVGSEIQYIQTRNQKELLERTMETLRSQLAMAEIIAPFDGRIEKIHLKAGENASPGRTVIELVNSGRLYVNTEISEAFIGSVKTGDMAILEFPSLAGAAMKVPVSFVSQVINPQSRTFSIRVELSNPNNEIKPNMLATLRLLVFNLENAVTVPTILIRHDLQGAFVYTAAESDGQHYASKTYVQTGPSDGVVTVVTEGLQSGNLLITKGYNQIKDGSLLEITGS